MKTELSSDKLVPFLSDKFNTELKYKPNSTIERKELFISNVNSVNEEDGTCECIITTEQMDRRGDIVVSSGIDTTEFKKIPSVFINHNYAALPIATCDSLVHKDKSIHAKIKFVTSVPAIKNIFELVKAGALKGISVGFEVKDCLIRGTKEFDSYIKGMSLDSNIAEQVQRIFTSWMLYEFSVCSIPCNANCYIKSLEDAKQEISPDLAKVLGYDKPIDNPYLDNPYLPKDYVDLFLKSEEPAEPEETTQPEETIDEELKEEAKTVEPKVVEPKVEPKAEVKPEVKVELPKYFNVIRTPKEVDEYIHKVVDAKLSGKLSIDW